jgi:hypothetical protein
MTGLRSAAERAEIRKRFSKHPVTSQRVDARKVDAACLLPWIHQRAAAFPEDSREYLEELTLAFVDSHSRSLQAAELYDAIGVLDDVAFDFVVDLWHHLLDAQVTAVALSSSERGHESSQAKFIPGVPPQIVSAANRCFQASEGPEPRQTEPPQRKDFEHGARPSERQSPDHREVQSLLETKLDHGNSPSPSVLRTEQANNCNISRAPDADIRQGRGSGCRALPVNSENHGPCVSVPTVFGTSEGHDIVVNKVKAKVQASSESHRFGEDNLRSSGLGDHRGRTVTRKRSRFSRDQRHVSPSPEDSRDVRWGSRGLETDHTAVVDCDVERGSRVEVSLEAEMKRSSQRARRDCSDRDRDRHRNWDSGCRNMENIDGSTLQRNDGGFESNGNDYSRKYRHRNDCHSDGITKRLRREDSSGRQRDASRRRDCTDEIDYNAKHERHPSPHFRDDRGASGSRRRESRELIEDDARDKNGYFGHARDASRSAPRYHGKPRDVGECRRDVSGPGRRPVRDRISGRTRRGKLSPIVQDFDHVPSLPKRSRKSSEGKEYFFNPSISKDQYLGRRASHGEHGLMIREVPLDRVGHPSSSRVQEANVESSGHAVTKNEDSPVLKFPISPKGLCEPSSAPLRSASRSETSGGKNSTCRANDLEKFASTKTLQRICPPSDRLEIMKKTLLLKLKVQRSLGMYKSSRKLEEAGDD